MKLIRPVTASFLALLFVQMIGGSNAVAQSDSLVVAPQQERVFWQLIADGRKAVWETELPFDSLATAARLAVQMLQQDGYYFAAIDSVEVDTSQTPARATLHATSGPRVEIGDILVEGATALEASTLLSLMDTRPGRILDPQRLEADLEAILVRYERAGYPLVQVSVKGVALIPGEQPSLGIVIQVDEGRSLNLRRVEVSGSERTRPAYVARVAELRVGQPLVGYNPEAIQQRLEATGYFSNVGAPELLVEGDSVAVLRIPLDEEPPGVFDLVLGYLPPAGGQGGGSLIGNGHLDLRNLFGGGRRLSLKLNRLPGQVSSVDVRASDPYVLGLPFNAEVRFEGLQQDSTFGKQRYGVGVGYLIAGGLHTFVTVSQEATRPGQFGDQLTSQGRQRIARSSALFAGLGIRYHRLDRRINPRRGIVFETNYERGRKERTARRVTAEQDTTTQRTLLRQERLRTETRLYRPLFRRQVLVLGGDALLLLGDEFDASDLFRFGGAVSLRGYDEERFLASIAARVLVEYRYLIDRTTYGFLFIDLGYVERSKTIDLDPLSGYYPGYGLGFQLGTEIGLINISLAANPEEPTGVRAHLGLSIGL